mgnify:FL=1
MSYVPKSLSEADKKKQIKSIKEKTVRPKLKSFETKRSTWVKKFEKKYGYKISEFSKINKELLTFTGINKVLDKGRGAYFSSGSRPNQTTESWGLARLASVLMFGPASKIDKDILIKHGRQGIKEKALKL